jgi:hypothetical protein
MAVVLIVWFVFRVLFESFLLVEKKLDSTDYINREKFRYNLFSADHKNIQYILHMD